MDSESTTTPLELIQRIDWFGQAAIRISSGDSTIYLDPYQLPVVNPAAVNPADLVLVTHGHKDHCSPDDLAKVVGDETVLVAPQDCLDELRQKGITGKRQLSLRPGEQATLAGVMVEAVPAYNVVKTRFHARDKAWVGYILTIEGIRVYHFGDTERVPEMKELSCDIALVPLGQTYTMGSVEEAAAAVRDVKATIAIPIHYGMYEGTAEDATQLKELLSDELKVVIKQPVAKQPVAKPPVP